MRLHFKRLFLGIVLLVFLTTLLLTLNASHSFFDTQNDQYSVVFVNKKPKQHSLKKQKNNEFVSTIKDEKWREVNTLVKNLNEQIIISKDHFIRTSEETTLLQPVKIVNNTNTKLIVRKIEEVQTPITTSQQASSMPQREYARLLRLHEKIKHFTSDAEILHIYNKDKIVKKIFEKPLDIESDQSLLKTLFPKANETEDRITAQLYLKLKNTTTKRLLFWSHNRNNIKTELLKSMECNIQDCVITHDKSEKYKSDVIIFKTVIPQVEPPKKHQVYIFSNLESSANSVRATSKNVAANWSETYRIDSVMVAPYERFTADSNFFNLPTKPIKNFALNKTKLVAWFVSNCNSRNNRLAYAKQLQKYISVDIYGNCGKLKCRRTNKDCFQKLKDDYKFYLSFENSNCKDYITEKLYWNAYLNDVVPIVMGAHPDEYKRVVPPRSHIHVDMFESPKELAEYLMFLDKHDHLYNSYLLWKGTGTFINTKSLCRLCAMAHIAPINPFWYDDPNEWWSGRDVCKKTISSETYSTWKINNKPFR